MARRAPIAASNKVQTRYGRVKEILDAAAGKKDASDYGGAGRFWDDLEKLKKAKIYGVRMIAPLHGSRPGITWPQVVGVP